MDRPLKETFYTPDSEPLSLGKLLRSMGRDLLAAFRELASRLLVHNISAQHRHWLLGPACAFELDIGCWVGHTPTFNVLPCEFSAQ